MSAYEAQAKAFLTEHGLVLKAAYQGNVCPLWCDDGRHIHGDKYRITIKRMWGDARKSISFDFWNSKADSDAGKAPTAYDVLACISSDFNTPETFADFCSDYGYDQDSRKAEQTFKAADKFARKLRSFFNREEEDDLSAIQ